MTELTVHDLSLGQPGPDAPTAILIHGITGNGLCLVRIADEIGRRHGEGAVRVLSPCLRGRADSRDVLPAGLDRHVEDLLALAAEAGAPPLLVGHSMGAFIAALAVAEHPTAFSGAVLVDGGMSFPVDPALDVDAALNAVIGPAMARLSMTFDDEAAYLAFWDQHPSLAPVLAGPGGDATRAYLRHDLIPNPDGPGMVSSCVLEAIRTDGGQVMFDPRLAPAVAKASAAGVPIEVVWAARGMFNEPQGMYDEQRLAALALPEAVRTTRADANHYSVILDDEPVGVIVDAIDRRLAG